MFDGIFQPLHLVVILVVALLVFGPKKLPELGKGLGEAISGFKKAVREGEASTTPSAETSATKSPAPTQKSDT